MSHKYTNPAVQDFKGNLSKNPYFYLLTFPFGYYGSVTFSGSFWLFWVFFCLFMALFSSLDSLDVQSPGIEIPNELTLHPRFDMLGAMSLFQPKTPEYRPPDVTPPSTNHCPLIKVSLNLSSGDLGNPLSWVWGGGWVRQKQPRYSYPTIFRKKSKNG